MTVAPRSATILGRPIALGVSTGGASARLEPRSGELTGCLEPSPQAPSAVAAAARHDACRAPERSFRPTYRRSPERPYRGGPNGCATTDRTGADGALGQISLPHETRSARVDFLPIRTTPTRWPFLLKNHEPCSRWNDIGSGAAPPRDARGPGRRQLSTAERLITTTHSSCSSLCAASVGRRPGVGLRASTAPVVARRICCAHGRPSAPSQHPGGRTTSAPAMARPGAARGHRDHSRAAMSSSIAERNPWNGISVRWGPDRPRSRARRAKVTCGTAEGAEHVGVSRLVSFVLDPAIPGTAGRGSNERIGSDVEAAEPPSAPSTRTWVHSSERHDGVRRT